MQINMSVALPERSRPPHKVLLVMPDLQIFIISPPDNLIMQRTRIHFAPRRKQARAALSFDYFPALPAALYKPTRTPSIMLLSPRLLGPRLQAPSCPAPFVWAAMCVPRSPERGRQEHLAHMTARPRNGHLGPHRARFFGLLGFLFICLFIVKTGFPKFSSSRVCASVMHHLA